MSTDFLLREIARGKLAARKHHTEGGRVFYTVDADAWARYLATHWPSAPTESPREPDATS